MRKLAVGVVAVAMLGVSSVPAFAHTLEQSADSGDVTQSIVITSDGTIAINSNINTGNVQSAIQYGSEDVTEPMMPELPVEGEMPSPDMPEGELPPTDGEAPELPPNVPDVPEGEMPPAPSGPPAGPPA